LLIQIVMSSSNYMQVFIIFADTESKGVKMLTGIKRKLQLTLCKCKSNFILVVTSIILAAMIFSGGIFFLLNGFIRDLFLSIVIAEVSSILLALIPCHFAACKFNHPRNAISRKIRNLGEGRFNEKIDLDQEEMFSDIAESVNLANRNLMDKMQSIIKNTNRLSAVEEELTSRFRPRNSIDIHTKNLVCQLKICTSRLRNDLSSFSLDEYDLENN